MLKYKKNHLNYYITKLQISQFKSRYRKEYSTIRILSQYRILNYKLKEIT